MITVKHSVDKSLCIETSAKITKTDLNNIEKKMRSIVDANLPITKVTVLKNEAIPSTKVEFTIFDPMTFPKTISF